MLHRLSTRHILCLIGFLLILASCGTTSRLKQDDSPSPTSSVEPPEVNDSPRYKPKAQKIVAISHMELSSLELIEEGTASWYGSKFDGRLTASGEVFDANELTAAHRTLPFNTIVLVKNLNNERTVVVRINDRGPYAHDRIIDLSRQAAKKLGIIDHGTAPVKLFTLKDALPESSIEDIKVATYTIQLGAYQQEESAFAYSNRIRGSRVEVEFIDNQKVFRVYYGLFSRKKRAQDVLNKLTLKDIDGFVTQIENS